MALELGAAAEAERQVVSAMLSDQKAVWTVLERLKPGDFHDPRHETIARRVATLSRDGKPTDQVAVANALEDAGELRTAGGLSYVLGLDTLVTVNVDYYADILAGASLRRRIANAAEVCRQLAGEPGEPDELADRAAQVWAEVQGRRTERGWDRPADEYMALIDEMAAPDQHYTRTPWRPLDDFISGFYPGRLYVIGARPAAGKSVMALQSALTLAQHGWVAFCSLEMSSRDIYTRVAAQLATVDLGRMERRTLDPTDWERLAGIRAKVEALRLAVNARPVQTILQVKAFARAVAREEGPLAAIVIDYLGLLQLPQDRRSRWEHVGDVSRACKVMSEELAVPVIAVAQLNRESTSGKPRLPQMSDLRDSGSIEQDADAVLLLNRQVDAEGRDTSLLDVIVAKNRRGRIGRFVLNFDGAHARLTTSGMLPPEPDPRVRLDLD